jgi:hypothetical protein
MELGFFSIVRGDRHADQEVVSQLIVMQVLLRNSLLSNLTVYMGSAEYSQ